MTAEELLDRFLDANGGRDRWAGVRGRFYRASAFQAGELDYRCEIRFGPDGCYRRDVERGGWTVQTTDGMGTWLRSPGGVLTDQTGTPAAVRFAESGDKEIPFIELERKRFGLALAEDSEVEGQRVVQLAITQRNGSQRVMGLHPETLALVSETLVTRLPSGDEQRVIQIFRDVREVGGLPFAFQVDRSLNGATVGSLRIESMEINPPHEAAAYRF